jgi:dTDP-4-dehydrorhamnose 3,5-epimerase
MKYKDDLNICELANLYGVFNPVNGLPIIIVPRKINLDNRGEFSRLFDSMELTSNLHQFKEGVIQSSISRSLVAGTLRGIHVQGSPSEEAKLVTVIKGSIIDFIIDLRKNSNSYLRKIQLEISEEDPFSILVPGGFGHGVYTLVSDTIVSYAMNVAYDPSKDLAINFRDKQLNLNLPGEVKCISDKDKNAPELKIVELTNLIGSVK